MMVNQDLPVCGVCGGVNTCSCPRTTRPQTLLQLLGVRFEEIGERMRKYCAADYEAGAAAIATLQDVFSRYYPNPEQVLFVKPDEVPDLLPLVPVEAPQVCPFNMTKTIFMVLLHAIRFHIPAPDMLKAAASLYTLEEIFKKARFTPRFMPHYS